MMDVVQGVLRVGLVEGKEKPKVTEGVSRTHFDRDSVPDSVNPYCVSRYPSVSTAISLPHR